VLGLIDQSGDATPYELKRIVAAGIGNFWSLQHAQLYTEPERLAGAGYLEETREQGGRRRKLYRLTAAGRKALRAWVSQPTEELPELRDVALLKMYFGANASELAEVQLAAHREKLREYERIEKAAGDGEPAGPRVTLRAGIDHEREWVRFWGSLAKDGGDDAGGRS